MYFYITKFILQVYSNSTKQNEWLLLNQEGKMTTPLDVAKSMESNITIYVVVVVVVLSVDSQKNDLFLNYFSFESIESTKPASPVDGFSSFKGKCI